MNAQQTQEASASPHNARQVALDIMGQVLFKKTPLDQIFETHEELPLLSSSDRAFARLLVMTVLRRIGEIDTVLARFLDKPEGLPPKLTNIVRLGAAQMLFLGTDAYAAVDTGVDLVDAPLAKYRNLVNAVLRRVSDFSGGYKSDDAAIMCNYPEWLYQSWVHDYGADKALAIARASLVEAATDVTLKDQSHAAGWAESLGAILLPNGSLRVQHGGRVNEWSGFDKGEWWVQDAAPSLPVRLIADEVRGKNVIDLCAAPGGKTAQLLAYGAAHVTAVDRSANRMKRLEDNLARLGLSATINVADGASFVPKEKADIILVDAPCSATGTLRRHPDLKYLKQEGDVGRLATVQERLLHHACAQLSTGGLLVYATCSLQKQEGEYQIEKFLQSHPDMVLEPVKNADQMGIAPFVDARGCVRITPDGWAAKGGIDGFFTALLRKI